MSTATTCCTAPVSPTRSRPRRSGKSAAAARLDLVEESPLLQTAGGLARKLDVVRREQHDLLADVLQTAVESVGETAAEVGQALRQVPPTALQVDDDGTIGPQVIGDLLGVIEVLGRDERELDARRAHDGKGPRGPLPRLRRVPKGLVAVDLIVVGTAAALASRRLAAALELYRSCERIVVSVGVVVVTSAAELADDCAKRLS